MNPQELKKLAEEIANQGITLGVAEYLIIFGLFIIGGLFGVYVSSYLKKKGEHLATKEDFDKLLDQLKKQTKETEKIKDELKKTSWLEQRRWDLKQKLYWEMAQITHKEKKQFILAKHEINNFKAFFIMNKDNQKVIQSYNIPVDEITKRALETLTQVDYTYNLSYVLLNPELHQKMEKIREENGDVLIVAGDKLVSLNIKIKGSSIDDIKEATIEAEKAINNAYDYLSKMSKSILDSATQELLEI